MRGTVTIAHLTWLEARRRRIVLVALLGGLAFLGLFAFAAIAMDRDISSGVVSLMQRQAQLYFLMLAGLYVVNFLAIAVAILLPVDTLSGEIKSGVMQTLASKPLRRSEILLGKWITYVLMTGAYLVLLAGGIVLTMLVVTDIDPPSLVKALPLMLLGAVVLLTITLAGGVRLSTIANGMVAFSFYGIAFVGGWIEQIGAAVGNDAALRIGTAISLVSPSEAMWRRAAHELQPPILRELPTLGPFASFAVPSNAMIVWTIGFVLVALMIALRQFRTRPL